MRQVGRQLNLQAVLAELGVCFVDLGGLGRGADGRDDRVPLGQELFDDVGGDEAGAA
jgi:hypothetical protein